MSSLMHDLRHAVRALRDHPALAAVAVLSPALGVIGLILLTACANVAGLLLGRGEARRGEIAVRQERVRVVTWTRSWTPPFRAPV